VAGTLATTRQHKYSQLPTPNGGGSNDPPPASSFHTVSGARMTFTRACRVTFNWFANVGGNLNMWLTVTVGPSSGSGGRSVVFRKRAEQNWGGGSEICASLTVVRAVGEWIDVQFWNNAGATVNIEVDTAVTYEATAL